MPITITWSLKGQELNSGPSVTTTMVGTRTSMLIISDVDFTHIGEYTCRAINEVGGERREATSEVIRLQVSGVPQVVKQVGSIGT